MNYLGNKLGKFGEDVKQIKGSKIRKRRIFISIRVLIDNGDRKWVGAFLFFSLSTEMMRIVLLLVVNTPLVKNIYIYSFSTSSSFLFLLCVWGISISAFS